MRAFNFIPRQFTLRNHLSLHQHCSRLQQSKRFLSSSGSCRLQHTKASINSRSPSISILQTFRSLVIRRFRQSRNNSTNGRPQPDPTPHLGSPEPSLSLSQRMRKLSREYGWSALGVYLGLSALDFPFCFLAVRMLGTERIGHWEHVIVSTIKDFIPFELLPAKAQAVVSTNEPAAVSTNDSLPDNWGVDKATEDAKRDDATIWTQLVLAYAIHKSFIFIRVPITAAVTPKVVKVLRGWGWDIGKRRPKTGSISSKKD